MKEESPGLKPNFSALARELGLSRQTVSKLWKEADQSPKPRKKENQNLILITPKSMQNSNRMPRRSELSSCIFKINMVRIVPSVTMTHSSRQCH